MLLYYVDGKTSQDIVNQMTRAVFVADTLVRNGWQVTWVEEGLEFDHAVVVGEVASLGAARSLGLEGDVTYDDLDEFDDDDFDLE